MNINRAAIMIHDLITYTDLQKQIHNDLRVQHPEWVRPNGECPICDSYEARLINTLKRLTQTESNESFRWQSD
jgi:hypothetical protein